MVETAVVTRTRLEDGTWSVDCSLCGHLKTFKNTASGGASRLLEGHIARRCENYRRLPPSPNQKPDGRLTRKTTPAPADAVLARAVRTRLAHSEVMLHISAWQAHERSGDPIQVLLKIERILRESDVRD